MVCMEWWIGGDFVIVVLGSGFVRDMKCTMLCCWVFSPPEPSFGFCILGCEFCLLTFNLCVLSSLSSSIF